MMITDLKFIEAKTLEFCEDNDRNLEISSAKYFNLPCCLGIDEAGRGPVLGPMVYAGAYTEIKHLERLNELGLDDSKKLKEDTRDELLGLLSDVETKLVGYEVEIISPNYISNEMLNIEKTNLNIISHNAALNIIRRVIDKGVDLKEVYVDTVGNPDKYKALILSHFPKLKVTVEIKADATYKIVSAASIFAKVVRDKCIKNWKPREKNGLSMENCGSGYPGDPVTKEYLKRCFDPIFGFPQFVRASWSTASLVMEKDCLEIQWEDVGSIQDVKFSKPGTKRKSNTSEADKFNKSVLDFYSPPVPDYRRHAFFTERKLERVATFN